MADFFNQLDRSKNWRIIGRGAGPAAITGDTDSHTLVTIPILGGAMGPNGVIRVSTLWTMTDNGNNKQMSVLLGATAFINAFVADKPTMRRDTLIQNAGAENAQVSFPAGAWDTANVHDDAVTEGAIDTSAAFNLLINGALADGGDSLQLRSYIVELLYGGA